MAGTLYVVATPIGNLEDITLRALRVLREADLIACEDTRQTRKLLDHYGIHQPTVSYHEHNEALRAPELIEKLESGSTIALVADAGTPLVSDPGYRLVAQAAGRACGWSRCPGPPPYSPRSRHPDCRPTSFTSAAFFQPAPPSARKPCPGSKTSRRP